jgi:hypothetical protein
LRRRSPVKKAAVQRLSERRAIILGEASRQEITSFA